MKYIAMGVTLVSCAMFAALAWQDVLVSAIQPLIWCALSLIYQLTEKK